MAVTTVPGVRTRHARTEFRSYTPSIEMAGALILLVGAWGGIVPFVGPLFGFSGDGSRSWTWNLPHALLSLAPGAVAVAAGILVMLAGGRLFRPGLKLGGLLAALCGAWFVVGPVAWPVLEHARVFVTASPQRELAYWIGYSLGPGTLLAALGAFVLGRPAARPAVAAPAAETRTAEARTVNPTPVPPT
jgi:hypothetical protein